MNYLFDSVANATSLKKFDEFARDNNNILVNFYKSPLYNDEPKIFAYSSSYKTKHRYLSNIASGYSFDKNTALVRMLGEGIERYCLDCYSPDNFINERPEGVKNYHLDPLDIVYFSKRQLNSNSFKNCKITKQSKFRWIYGLSLTSKRRILIPAQLAIFNYKALRDEPTILFPTSTGTAAGSSLSEALYRGICEVVERDAFMIAYLNRLPSPRIDLISMQDRNINNILNIFTRYKLELVVLNLTTDLGIPAFAAITLDRTGLGPAVSIGLKAGFNIKEAIIGAIEESLMTRSWIRDKFVYTNPKYKRGKIIRTIEDRSHFWFSVNMIKYLDFWLTGKSFKKISIKDLVHTENKLEKIVKLLKEKRIDVIYVDITDKEVKKYGFVVVKVIIPQLQPLYLDEKYPYLGGKRLYATPVKMGMLQKPNSENQLNKISHPFL